MIEARQMGLVAIGHAHQDATKSTPEGSAYKIQPGLTQRSNLRTIRRRLRASGRSVLALGKMPEVAYNHRCRKSTL